MDNIATSSQSVEKAVAALSEQIADEIQQHDESKGIKKVNSRFGEITIDVNNAICFDHGMLGIPGVVHFCITTFPENEHPQFRLLQCVEDDELCFIVVPALYDNHLLEKKDLDDAANVLDYNIDDLIVLFIVTVQESGGERHLAVNAKAPVLIDASKKQASQYVFQNPNYSLRHMIS